MFQASGLILFRIDRNPEFLAQYFRTISYDAI